MDKNIVSFAALNTLDFEIADLFAMTQKWQRGVVFSRNSPRPVTGIIYLNGCTGQYTAADGASFFAPEGSLICLPALSRYEVLNIDCGLSRPDAWLVEFNIIQNGALLTPGDAPFMLEQTSAALAGEYIAAAAQAYESPVRAPLALKNAVWRLIALLSQSAQRPEKGKYQPILRGVELMKEHALSDTPIEEIARLCGLSAGGFRKLFREYSGQSPMQYRMALRMAMAKKLLEDSDMTLDEIAATLNLESGAYFCKLFRRQCGQTPGAYRRQYRR